MIDRIMSQLFAWADAIIGQFIGERCELCRKTYTKLGIAKGDGLKVVWCLPCMRAELQRWGVLPSKDTDTWHEIRK